MQHVRLIYNYSSDYFLNCTSVSHITINILISHPNFVTFASGFTDCKKCANLIINNWYYFIIRSKRKKLRVTLSVCVQKNDLDKLLVTNVFSCNISGTWNGRTVLYLTKFLWSACLCTKISRRHFLTVLYSILIIKYEKHKLRKS